MGIFGKLFRYFLVVGLISSCTGKPVKPRSLEISMSAIMVNNVAGGAVIRVENVTTGIYTDVNLTKPPFTILVADGKWNIYLVGFLGPGAWAGGTQCGGALGMDLGPTTSEIHVTVSAANCDNSPYSTLISSKVSQWDSATWDTSTWGL